MIDSKHCPYCNSPISSQILKFRMFTISGDFYTSPLANSGSSEDLAYVIYHYLCPDCKKPSVFFEGRADPFISASRMILPKSTAPIFPEYVPEAIRRDFTEAFETASISPKASATLSRRCLQGMIRDVFHTNERTLYAEISAIQSMVSSREWNAINSVRQIGNIGAHMEADINTIIEVEPEEAETLLLFIEYLIREWYINRHEDDVLINRINEINTNKQRQRNQSN